MRLLILYLFLQFVPNLMYSQEESWFFIRAYEEAFEMEFEEKEGKLYYVGENKRLAKTLEAYQIKAFKKTYRNAIYPFLKKTFL